MTDAQADRPIAAQDRDSGLAALVVMLAFHERQADPARLRHELGHGADVSADDIVRIAKREGVQARIARVAWPALARSPLPAIAVLDDGFVVLGRAGEEEVLVQEPVTGQDAAGLRSDAMTYDVLIEDANEAPTITSATFAGSEASPGFGTASLGEIGWSDPDPSPMFRNPTFSVDDHAMFSVRSKPGVHEAFELMLQGKFDYEVKSRYYPTITITDQGGLQNSAVGTVTVSDVNEAPNPYATYAQWLEMRTVYHFDPNDPDDFSDFVVSDISSDNGDWAVYGYYKASSNKIIVGISDPAAPWGGSSYGTISMTVADKGGAGASRTITLYTHVEGRTPRHGEHQPPVVLDLDGDGVELVSLRTSQISFDMDGDGQRDRTGWVAADDAFLVVDKNGNGSIDQASEFSFATDFENAVSDLQGLRAYDTDNDGYFDTDDAEFARFQVWQDRNQDGVSQPGELSSLSDRGLVSLRLQLTETGAGLAGATDNVLFATSEFYKRNGASLDVGDVFLAYERSGAAAGQVVDVDALRETGPREQVRDADMPTDASRSRGVGFAGLNANEPLPDKLNRPSNASTDLRPVTGSVKDTIVSLTAYAGIPGEQVPVTSSAGSPLPSVPPGTASRRSPTIPVTPADAAPAVAERPAAARPSDAEPSRDDAARDHAMARTDMARPAEERDTTVAPVRPGSIDAAARAAAILRDGGGVSLSSLTGAAYDRMPGRAPLAARTADLRVDRLIAAMAAFQDGEAMGALDLAGPPQIDTVLAQLAPAI